MSSRAGADGGLNAVKLQRGLLRVARVHGLRDAAYYAANRERVDALIARLCRAAAVPLIAYGGAGRHARKYFPRRARRYLALERAHGHPMRLLRAGVLSTGAAKRALLPRCSASGSGARAPDAVPDMITAEVLPASQGLRGVARAVGRLYRRTRARAVAVVDWSRAIMRNHLARRPRLVHRGAEPRPASLRAIVPMVATRVNACRDSES